MNWTFEYTPAVSERFDWQAITEAFDWVQNLKDVPQDPIWHAEGDVYIHTRMVADELIGLEEWQDLSDTNRSILFLSALMHDIAKPICTVEIDGRIRSPKHAKVGAQVTRAKLFRMGIPFEVREKIVELVRYHGLPLWIMDKKEPEKEAIRVSQHLNLNQLAMLAKADVLGRICPDTEELLERIEFFKAIAEEQGCLDAPFEFETNLARFTYFSKTDNSPHYVPFDDLQNEVILLSGLPGAGKNNWVAEYGQGYEQVCLDDIRRAMKISPRANQGIVIQTAKEQAKEYLRAKQPFIWNATNLTRQNRKKLIDLFVSYKARVKIVYIEASYQTLLDRNQTREFPIPPNVLERFANKFEAPRLDEAHEVSYYIED
jgi:predicted kinase